MTKDNIVGDWDYTTLPSNIRIGDQCFIERSQSFDRFRSTKSPGLVIGNRVSIYTWTTFNIEPSGFVEVGDDSVLVGAVFMCQNSIIIGKNVLISYHVTIADSDFHPHDPELRKQDAIANAPNGNKSLRPAVSSSAVRICDGAQIGIGAIILKGVRIGIEARVQAGSVVSRDVPDYALVEGSPAKLVAKINE